MNNIRIYYRPIDSPLVQIQSAVPEFSKDYPEPQRFGVMPSYGFFIRYVRNIEMNNVEISYMGEETRPAMMLEDVKGITLNNFKAQTPAGRPVVVHRGLKDISIFPVGSIPKNKIRKEVQPVTVPDPAPRRGQN